MVILRIVLLFLFTCTISGCVHEDRLDSGKVVSGSPRSQETDAASIRSNLQHFVRADIAGDGKILSSYLVDDVVWMPPDDSVVVGRDAVLLYLSQNQAPSSLRVTPTAIAVSNHLASLRGIFEIEVDGIRVTGKMAQQWIREDSEWRIAWDIWNLDGSEE